MHSIIPSHPHLGKWVPEGEERERGFGRGGGSSPAIWVGERRGQLQPKATLTGGVSAEVPAWPLVGGVAPIQEN